MEVADQVKSVMKDYSQLRLSYGRKVLEIRPTIKWDKGNAVEFLLESLGIIILYTTSFFIIMLAGFSDNRFLQVTMSPTTSCRFTLAMIEPMKMHLE